MVKGLSKFYAIMLITIATSFLLVSGFGEETDLWLEFPEDGMGIYMQDFDLEFSIKEGMAEFEGANCTLHYWNSSGFEWTETQDSLFGAGMNEFLISGLAPGDYTWDVYCFEPQFDPPEEGIWATNESGEWDIGVTTWSFSIPACAVYSNSSSCEASENCTWDDYGGMCIEDCWQHDQSNNATCESAYGGGVCAWDNSSQLCDPANFHKGWEGFSPCFEYDGNETGCGTMPDDCAWFSESNCQPSYPCWDVSGGTNHGICNPNNFNFGGDFNCIQHDGNKTGCDYAIQTLGWTCSWMSDSWGPLEDGETEAGWCNDMFGGGGAGGIGCFDYYDNESCTSAASIGMPCEWKSQSGDGWCEQKGCWNYWDSGSCAAAADEGCLWEDNYNYCYEIGCWDMSNTTECSDAQSNYGLNCNWQGTEDNGWCEENGCWKLDWTDESTCEAQDGCTWDDNWCNQIGCWEFDVNGSAVCNNKTLTGIDCQWSTGSMGWCEQKGCWSYDSTNQTNCENVTADMGLSCVWSNSSGEETCFEEIKGCSDYDGNEFGCYGTGWCFWNGTCNEPSFDSNFFNPGCWVFDQPGEAKCNNVTTCNWNSGVCEDNGADANNGVQCIDIDNSEMCNNIPMLSTCCQWNGTGCQGAPMSTACWDNMQEPPEGAYFCDDYNAKNSKSTCEQIAGDPWYMPCYWNATTEVCKFEFDNLFGAGGPGGDFGFEDIGSQSNCDAAGGTWKSEKWSDPSGAIYTDEWCEMGFGMGKESCNDMCWACEFQDNGTIWASQDEARSACEQSSDGCTFFPDTNSFNGQGWCDKDFGKIGNCDGNCWDCWDQSQCSSSLAKCKWFVDPYNSNVGWCDDKNVKTCEDDCYSCWDQDNCMNSVASCTWDTGNWFCTPKGSGEGGQSSEICFDGIDNDADTFVDCEDPECAFDPFCGGSSVFGSNCPSISDESACGVQNCTWIVDKWNNSWCDMPGAQCWLYDDNSTACEGEDGCNYNNMSNFGMTGDFCDVNFTKTDEAQCWNYDNNTCGDHTAEGCVWTEDMWCDSPEGQNDQWCIDNPDAGWCDYKTWSCWQHDNNETACDEVEYCGWQTDWFNPDNGWCGPVCFSLNESTCGSSEYCELFDAEGFGWCEPENMFKGCWDYFTSGPCDGDDACTWVEDPFVPGGGFCSDNFMYEMVGNMDKSPPHELAVETCDTQGANAENDICFLGVKDDPQNFGIGIGVASMDNAAVCSKFGEGGSNETTKFYWYTDMDGSQTGGCTPDDDTSLVGFDFKFKYEALMQNNVLKETKVAYKCIDGNWSASKIKLNAWPDKMCYMVVGGMIAISKEDLSKLSVLGLYDENADMRIYATTAGNGSGQLEISSASPDDTIGPVWYSPNSADVKFEDCGGFVDSDGDGLLPEDDPDCMDYLRYGYIEIESGTECGDSIDNDGNGLTDCADPGCMYDAYYCTASDYAGDNTAPKITWKNVESFIDGGFIDLNTDEPTNATVIFYKNDSYCSNTTSAYLNEWTFNDWKLDNALTFDDYDVWHGLPLDQFYFDENSVNYTFATNSTYYYKLKVCDQSGNCAASACSPFTTRTAEKEFVIGFELPPYNLANIEGFMGNVNVKFDWGGGDNFEDVITGNAGKKINQTKGKNVNMKFTNPNATKQWDINLMGVSIKDAQSINVSNDLLVNETADGDMLVGIKKDKWKELAQKLGVNYVKIKIPQGVSDTSRGRIKHCPDDTIDADDTDCVEIDLNDVNCTFTAAETICEIPTNIGFSVFAVYMVSASTPPGDSPGGGSSSPSGGGGAAAAQEISLMVGEPVEKTLTVGGKVSFSYASKAHSVTLDSITNGKAKITIASAPITAILGLGEAVKKDLDGDGDNDLEVKLVALYETAAKFSFTELVEEVVPTEIEPISEEEAKEEVKEKAKGGFQVWFLVLGAAVLAVVLFLLLKKKS